MKRSNHLTRNEVEERLSTVHRPWEVSFRLIVQMLIDGFGYDYICHDSDMDAFVYRNDKGDVICTSAISLLYYLNYGEVL